MARQRRRNVTLEVTPRGRRWVVSVLLDEEVIHVDRIDLMAARARTRFIVDLGRIATSRELPIDVAAVEAALIAHANENRAQIAGDDNRASRSGGVLIEPDEVLQDLRLEVIGETDDNAIVVRSTETQKISIVKSPSRLQLAELQQIAGEASIGTVHANSGAGWQLSQVQEALALRAAQAPRLDAGRRLGQGVHHEDGMILVVNGEHAFTLENGSLIAHASSRLGRFLIELNAQHAPWSRDLAGQLHRMTEHRAGALFHQLQRHVAQWNWSHGHDAQVIAALLFATYAQACWTWRPIIAITGSSDSGKSTFFQRLVLPLFGAWTILADRSTEAGLRQAIGNNMAPLLIDEFDRYQHRAKVLELLRTTSRGGQVLRGTQNQTGLQFRVRHLPWLAAIESGTRWAQDRNRFIELELHPPTNRGLLDLPPESQLASMGAELAAASLWSIQAVRPMAERLAATSIDEVHGRLVESFSLPAAMATILAHGLNAEVEQGEQILRAMLANRDRVNPDPDEQELLRDILASTVRSSEGSIASVAQLLANPRDARMLEAFGVRWITRRGQGPGLFLVPEIVTRELLANTRWAESRIDQVLLRLQDARREQQRVANQRQRGVTILLQSLRRLGIEVPNRTP